MSATNGFFKPPKAHKEGLKCAWVVYLLTTPSYLPGVLLLAHTIKKYKSRYPLIVAVNPALPQEAKDTLRAYDLEVREVQPLLPKGEVTLIAERFADTWTKLTLFGFTEYDRLVLIDGDMMLRKNMDELFDLDLDPDQIAATHACVCNLDRSSWAPEDWTREQCPFTPTHHPAALTEPKPAATAPRTYTLLNSGLVVLTPSKPIMDRIEQVLSSELAEDAEKVRSWMFPDQDLLADVFFGKWIALPWIYNGLKTMRYWHGNFWRDEEVKNVHYICDKPWKRRPEMRDGRYVVDAGRYAEVMDGDVGTDNLRADAVTHDWWWQEWEEMKHLPYVDDLVAK